MRNEDVLEMIREARKGTESAIRACHFMKDVDEKNAVAYRIAASDLEAANTQIVKTIAALATLEDSGTSLEDLELPVRTYHILKREGIDTIEQLIRKTQNEVIKIRGMGARSYNEIVEALERRGLQLRRY